MEDTDKKFCSILFDILEQKGVRHVVCSPGSRNVPLLLAAASRPFMKKHFVVDERSAGFVGLGISMVKQEPVALICTSGTALLNYAPAVAEAYYQSIPLIVISADRPIQWIDQDDSQTLRQDEALKNYVKKSYSIPAIGDDDAEMQWFVNRVTNDAVMEACGRRCGPVHINIHLSEPLNLKKEKNNKPIRIINEFIGDSIANKDIIKNLAKEIADSKIMLVAGFGLPDSYVQKAVSDLSRFPNISVMAETISNLHLNENDYSIDSVLTAFPIEELDKLAPDIIITIGGSLISRKLKEYLRRNKDKCHHWAVGYSHTTSDPFMSLSLKIEVEVSRFFKNISSALRKLKIAETAVNYKLHWEEKRQHALSLKNKFVEKSGWSELKAFSIILNAIPKDYNLFFSNGTPIRYAQIIKYKLPHASYCNRGVSGIDGSIASAIGASFVFKGETLLITGDLSMAYDVGSLGIKDIPSRFKIIVIDNQGGGIFRFIPSTSQLEEREEYLCQAPILPLQDLAQGYGFDYFEASDEKKLYEVLPKFFSSAQKSILRIICDGEYSADVLKNYMNLNFTIGHN
ncbi:MAG: 2-succinyl-5-enolpyruvyl-6-hydroxy-3-cyclohexene-1-carboxylic-acid synthase [Muribaculaceae bacterium]|nr:2-succinyl-5-enolpyruvyl-6-hydroxy-3-cyclohexene-1-carboxylic-acid synthase [Muribaculaceae bacterium]